jgi:hypothetical protein
MAQKVEVTITSDLSGDPGAHGVTIGLDGSFTELDLTEAEHAALKRDLDAYFEKGRKATVTGKRGPGRPKAAKAAAGVPGGTTGGGSGLTKEERQAVRDFAATHGHPLSTRGRLPDLAITAWRQQSAEILSHLAA